MLKYCLHFKTINMHLTCILSILLQKKNTWALQMSYLRLILLHICSWNQSAIVLMKQKSWRHTTFEYNNKPMKLLLLKSWLVTPTCLYFSPTNINIWGVSCSKKSHGEVNVCKVCKVLWLYCLIVSIIKNSWLVHNFDRK